ncbi:MAG: DEAD/DEAH box helicase [Clostridia bacterium]|nr:DEAD/DEAH box helicase [Clostridia bacterium]
MIVDENILDEIYESVGETRINKAKRFIEDGRVKVNKVTYEDTNNFTIRAKVYGDTGKYNTFVRVENGEIEDVECECMDYQTNYGTCKHIAATLIGFSENQEYINIFDKEKPNVEIVKNEGLDNLSVSNKPFRENKDSYRIFNQMIKGFYQDEKAKMVGDGKVNKVEILPHLIYDPYRGNLEIDFKIGNKQLYKLRNLTEFYKRVKDNRYYKYGAKLEFIHYREAFSENSKPLLDFILKYAEMFEYVNNNNNYYNDYIKDNSIRLDKTRMDEAFEILKGKEIECIQENRSDKSSLIKFIDSDPDIKFNIKEENSYEYTISPNINIYEYRIIEGDSNIYFLYGGKNLYRCTEQFRRTTLKLLQTFRENFSKEITFKKEDFPNFLSVVFPKVKENINMESLRKEEIEKFIPLDLSVKMYLDYDNNNRIVSKVRFCYGDREYNPFSEEKVDIVKNIAQENKVLNMFMSTGFLKDLQNERIILIDEEKIYNFLSEEIEEYMKKFEVLATDSFKEKEIKQPKLSSIGVKVENNLLNIDFNELNFDKDELVQIMEKYHLKKKYHRLKNGKFIELTENETMDFIENVATGMDLDFKQIESGKLKLPLYRTMYMDRLLESVSSSNIKKDEQYKNIVEKVGKRDFDDEIKIPSNINAELRNYQKIGFKWIKVLDEYKLGGILADDMGLGKTLQLILVIASYIEQNKNPKPSIVVCPSSLTLNWKNEIDRFSSNIKSIVINGNLNERKEKIEKLRDYDVVITSYDSLKRDVEIYEENDFQFKYIIADEAQYIKNANTQNARVVKKLVSETRYALTGTPIENSLSELWSIFDFIMPGYLFSYKKFKTLYELPIVRDEDQKAMQKLKMLIEPFILRRIKKEVLTELPDKTMTVLNNEMEIEQSRIYASYMQRAKVEAINEINTNGIEKSQIKILALLMRLRQICCHPSLFIENYEGESSKLNQCIEIIKDAVEGNHKILLFSGYTSMFEIIECELKKENIKFLKLTGQTKVADRIELVDEFNTNEEVKVFLISLKAGGTGLNLTGADMVIHYDPWWNISAENQATDRTYRIGQKRNVQVYKLITKNTIEEKIYELQKKKEKLIDNMLTTGETFINKLSKEDIINLFS